MKLVKITFLVSFSVVLLASGLFFYFQPTPNHDFRKYISQSNYHESKNSDMKGHKDTKVRDKIVRSPSATVRTADRVVAPLRKKLTPTPSRLNIQQMPMKIDQHEVVAGSKFSVRGKRFSLLKNYFAVKDNFDNLPVHSSIGGLSIIKYEEVDPPEDAYQVVINFKNNRTYIFRGIIHMTFYEDESSKAIIEKINTKILDVAEKVSANLVESYPHLNIVAYQFEDYAQTIRAFKILNQNGMVKTARLELIDASRTDN